MATALTNAVRLARAGWVLAFQGVGVLPEGLRVPGPVRAFSRMRKRDHARKPPERRQRLSAALSKLGPSYIKLGQFLATRDDLVGPDLAADLASLQDRLPPFPTDVAKAAVAESLGAPVETVFAEFGPPIGAASIAQVHKAIVRDKTGALSPVAVKVLRPDIERRFGKDLDAFAFAARLIEQLHEPSRRLRPKAVVETLAQSVAVEMDLRLEAAAISEMAENIKDDEGFRVPRVDWTRSARRVLTLEWIDGIPLADQARLRAEGHDPSRLGRTLIQSFLKHAMRDGFFHADMHPGNLFVDADGDIVAVDFGIMGRLQVKERRFLAEILHGFITRNYRRVAEVHFEAGYVPRHQSVDMFAQALRAIGEPLMDKAAEEISMGALLGQLLQYTEVFEMQTRPELILLQKTMVVVEGVARSLDPRLNIFTTAEPVVREWMESQLGAEMRLNEAAEGAASLGRLVGDIPRLLGRAERTAEALWDMAEGGLRLDQVTIERLAEAQSNRSWVSRTALWVGALSLVVIACALIF